MASRKRNKRGNGTGSVFKRTEGGSWIAAWYDHAGERKTRTTGTTDRAAAERILAKYVSDAALRREGVIDVRVEATAKQARRALSDHLEDWKKYLEGKGNTPHHSAQMHRAATQLAQDAGATMLGELTPAKVQKALSDLRGKGRALRTCNWYLQALRGFSRWATRDGRLSADPLAGMSQYNAATDKRRERRPLTVEELTYVLATTENGPVWRGIAGVDRAMVYRVALGTGFRASELRSLTPAGFDLDSDPPAITVKAGYSKRRRDDRQPIRQDLAQRLRTYLATRDDVGPALCVHERTNEMLRADLRRAKAKWIKETSDPTERRERRRSGFLATVDSEGRVADFHGLRATYITMLVKGGATVKVAQELARHSDPKLTMNTYTKLGVHDLTGALDGLLRETTADDEAETDVMLANGTDHARAEAARSNRRSNRGADGSGRTRQGAAGRGLRLAGEDDENSVKSRGNSDSPRPDAAESETSVCATVLEKAGMLFLWCTPGNSEDFFSGSANRFEVSNDSRCTRGTRLRLM